MNRIIGAMFLAAILMGHWPGTASAGDHDSAVGSSAARSAIQSGPVYTRTVGLAGYSPVSYIERRRAEPGSPQFAAEHDGVTYFFTSEQQQQMFEADPDRYVPAYGGHCAYGCSVNARLVPDPTSFRIIDGRTHLFLNNGDINARKLWDESDPAEVKARADRFWAAQSESRAYLNARNIPASGVALDGYSPVSYFTVGHAEPGDPRFSVEHEGVTYRLTSPEQVELFRKNPARYVPEFGGWCAFGMAVQDKFPVDPTVFKIIDDKLYLFLRNEQVNALQLWNRGDETELLRKAGAHWAVVTGG